MTASLTREALGEVGFLFRLALGFWFRLGATWQAKHFTIVLSRQVSVERFEICLLSHLLRRHQFEKNGSSKNLFASLQFSLLG